MSAIFLDLRKNASNLNVDITKSVPDSNWESDITAHQTTPSRAVLRPLPSSALFHPVSTNMNSAAVPLPPVFHTVDEMYPLEGEDLKEIQSR